MSEREAVGYLEAYTEIMKGDRKERKYKVLKGVKSASSKPTRSGLR